MHYCKDKKLNKKTTDLQKKVIETENPNFIIYTGDMISGEDYSQWIDWLINPGWFRKKWQEYSSIPKEKKIPYSIVMGNHDLNAHLPGEMIVDMDRNNPYSLTKHSSKGVKGSTNVIYYLFILIFFNSIYCLFMIKMKKMLFYIYGFLIHKLIHAKKRIIIVVQFIKQQLIGIKKNQKRIIKNIKEIFQDWYSFIFQHLNMQKNLKM